MVVMKCITQPNTSNGMEMMKGKNAATESIIYEIKVQGALDDSWSDWFSGMAISYAEGVTTLRGKVIDQSVLRGMLSKIWDLNLTLISINQVGPSDYTITSK